MASISNSASIDTIRRNASFLTLPHFSVSLLRTPLLRHFTFSSFSHDHSRNCKLKQLVRVDKCVNWRFSHSGLYFLLPLAVCILTTCRLCKQVVFVKILPSLREAKRGAGKQEDTYHRQPLKTLKAHRDWKQSVHADIVGPHLNKSAALSARVCALLPTIALHSFEPLLSDLSNRSLPHPPIDSASLLKAVWQ